jgi:biopolymer transport protein ExbB
VGFCSFEDDRCPTGQRFGEFAGEGLAGACVEPPDASTGTSTSGETSNPTLPTTDPPTTDDTASATSDPGESSESGSPPSDAWWDCAWPARRRLSIEAPTNAAGATAVPILVALDNTRIDYDITAFGGADLRFIADDQRTELAFEIDAWDPGGTSFIWVDVPQLAASTVFYMYWGNPDADAPAVAMPWAGYGGVWHLGTSGDDSTPNAHIGELVGTMAGPGQIDGGQQFPGVTAGLSIVSLPSIDDVFAGGGMVSAWVRPSASSSSEGTIAAKSSNGQGDNGWVFSVAGQLVRFRRGYTMGRSAWSTPPGSLPSSAWSHVAVLFDDQSPTPVILIDAVPQPLDLPGNPGSGPADSDAGQTLLIGGDAASFEDVFNGYLDEVRISSAPRDEAWVTLEVLSGSDALVVYGPQESC